MHSELTTVVRNAFDAARRQLRELTMKQRGFVKRHEEGQAPAMINRVFPEEGYGFLMTADQREVYFHRNSLTNADFDTLQPGIGVRFTEEDGNQGTQAVAVEVIGREPG